jgi:dolichol-phosphate mannosyltransferase
MAGDSRRGSLTGVGLTEGTRKLWGWLKFALVGASGLIVNQALVIVFTEVAGIYYVASAILATFGSTSTNFALAESWAFADRRPRGTVGTRFTAFLGLNLALLVARIPMLWILTEGAGLHYTVSNLVSLVVLFGLRLAIADRWLWGNSRQTTFAGEPAELTETGAVAGEREARFRYNVADLLAIESDVELRELRYFGTSRIGPPDIRIKIAFVAPRPTTRVLFEAKGDKLVYREHLGPLSANFSLKMGDPIDIVVSPTLAMSPHVVYTNIVEAFLRFLLVSKGYVLLHSAGLVGEHGATLLSAQTDTGKTSTVISLVRSRGYRFLSDDMTIIDPRGEAISYPKPMTLSFHTMGVAKDGRLSLADRSALAIQSRLHSKSGRSVGKALGERNLPIMTVNSAVQFLVPPPKHRIEDLFECRVGGRAPIRSIVLMERGEETLEQVDLDATVAKLIENTDDAYGFPPFALFAPLIKIGGDDYAALRRKEVELLRSAIQNADRWHLRVPGHEWAERLPAIIDEPPLVAVGPGADVDHRPVAVGPGHASDRAGVPVAAAALAFAMDGETDQAGTRLS